MWETCHSCQQRVLANDVHSCWDETLRVALMEAERAVLAAAINAYDKYLAERGDFALPLSLLALRDAVAAYRSKAAL